MVVIQNTKMKEYFADNDIFQLINVISTSNCMYVYNERKLGELPSHYLRLFLRRIDNNNSFSSTYICTTENFL